MNLLKIIHFKLFYKLLCLLIISTSIYTINAQDIHFSQYFSSPLIISPANTGNFEGDYRISYNQKNQWSVISPYNTFALSYDQPYYYRKTKYSIGGLFIHDRTNNGLFNTTKLYVLGALHKIYNSHYLHFGIQAGMVVNSLSNDVVFASQYNDILADYDKNGTPDNFSDLQDNSAYLDINIGLGWHKKFNKIEPHVNVSLFHANSPNNSFTSAKNILSARKVINIFSNWYLLDKVYITPGLLYMNTSGATDMYLGSNATFILSKEPMEKSIYVGVYFKNEFKNFDALVLASGVNYNEWQFGLSYDINMSGLKIATKSRGGIEISLIYKALSTRTKNYTLPCERF